MISRLTILLFAVLFSTFSFAQTEVTIKDGDLEGNMTYNWTSDNTYILDGLVYLEAGGRLNIEPGTVIKALSQDQVTTGDNTTALIITRDAQIFAEGAADNPIIFTANDDDTSDPEDFSAVDRGEWGGLIILGNATIANSDETDNIEGISANETRAVYGGTNDQDNSGVLRYVSIRHGGAQLSTDNEINGLTLGAVGSGTVVEYIEVFANLDDGIEFFGGTVDVKYATVAFCGDDAFDYDQGWRGRGQFWFAIQAPNTSTGRSGEHDGATPDNVAPFSNPTIYNATYIGIGENGVATGGDANREGRQQSVVFRDNAGGAYRNSLFTGFNQRAIAIEDRPNDDIDSYQRFLDGDLVIENNLFENFGAGNTAADLFNAINQDEEIVPGASNDMVNATLGGANEIGASGIASISREPNMMLDPRIDAEGAALTGGVPADSDDFFQAVSYRGAFNNSTNWLEDWTALSHMNYLGDLVEEVDDFDCIVIRDEDLVGGMTYNWTSNNCYTLDGLVYLEADGVLNIEAGTVIRGLDRDRVTSGDNTSALIITRDATINATGTATDPIIFTAADDDLNDPEDFTSVDRGEWGGVIILGNATIANSDPTDNIEGIAATETRAVYGGNDDADNSGILRYISIRHGGAQLSADNEINGLTLGAVGSGTEIDYVEVFANLDDGIEWFGGTVTVDHAAVSFCGDDAYDYDQGWKGGGQFWYSLQGPGTSTGRAGEHDGATPDGAMPFSQPLICNATYVGIGANESATGGDANREGRQQAVIFRDNAAGSYNNSIFSDFNGSAIAIEDRDNDEVDSWARFQAGDLELNNNIFWSFGFGDTPADIFTVVNPDEEVQTTQSATFATAMTTAGNRILDPKFIDADRDMAGGDIDPRPNEFADAGYGAPAVDGCETVEYFGAFEPAEDNGNSQPAWINGWTALTTSNIVINATTSVGEVEENGFLLDAPVPNPAYDVATVSFTLPQASQLTLTVVDLMGRPLSSTTRQYGAGEQRVRINVGNLPNGTYLILLDAQGSRLVQKLVVNK
ncbi:T9SS type A sorting domain-containing protein [Lewinella sp. W8]|uniref:T9SS type A sorting domain-containing protein n=1 Tax=Lewinella sp. W8 TaxID=2528208 RepID=UPI0010674F87|nr:T9SS type A sorting domain-containing protein [Lewinella sp. W8]MTB52542.1 T9SS type A sorting domain-containing protein [Lewinella sp. W8]